MRTAEERDPDIDLGLFVQGLLDRPSRPFLRDVELEGGGGGGTAGIPGLLSYRPNPTISVLYYWSPKP